MSYAKASSEDRIVLESLTDLVEEEKKTLPKPQPQQDKWSKLLEKHRQIRQQYLQKITKEHLEKVIAKAIASDDNECVVIDDCYWEDDCSRHYVFYSMDIYDELEAVVPEGTRIITEHTCWRDKEDKRKCRFVVKIRWGRYSLKDILDYLCCLGRCCCCISVVSNEEDL